MNEDHDIAIELGGAGANVIYVVHCLPSAFPDISVSAKADDVSDGFLFLAPRYKDAAQKTVGHIAVLDNNGVPRFHRAHSQPWDFRPVKHPFVEAGIEVRYIVGRAFFSDAFEELDIDLLWNSGVNIHDFLTTAEGTFVGLFQETRDRDLRGFYDSRWE